MRRTHFPWLQRLLWPLALLVSLAYHLQTPPALRVARDLLAENLSRAIAGDLQIGAIESLSLLGGVRARDVTLRDPQGREVLHVAQLSLTVHPYLPGQIRLVFSAAEARNARLKLIPDEAGLPTFITALKPTAKPDSPSDAIWERLLQRLLPSGGWVRALTLHNIQITGDALGQRDISAVVERGRLRLELGSTLELQLRDVQGHLDRPLGLRIDLDKVQADFVVDESQHLSLAGQLSHGSASAGLRLVYKHAESGSALNGLFDLSQIDANTLGGLGLTFLSPLASPLHGALRLRGAPDDLLVTAALDSDAGGLQMFGRMQAGVPLRFTFETQHLDLSLAIASGPAITVAGKLEVQVPQGSQQPIPIEADLDPTRALGLWWPSLHLKGNIHPHRFVLQQLTARAPGARLRGQGVVSFAGRSQLKAHVHFDDVGRDARLRALLPNVRGQLDGDLELNLGNWTRPTLDARGNLQLLHVQYGELNAKRVSISGTLSGPITRPNLKLRVQGKDLSFRGFVLGQGQAHVAGGPRAFKLEGTLDQPGSHYFQINGSTTIRRNGFSVQAEQLQLFVGRESFRGALAGLHVVHNQSLFVDHLLLASRSQRLEVHGTIRYRGDDTFLAQLQDFDVAALSAVIGPEFPVQAGRVDALLQVTGDMRHPRVLIQGALRGGELYDFNNVQALYMAQYADERIDLDGEVNLGGAGTLHLLGEGRVPGPLPDFVQALDSASYHLRLDATHIELDRIPHMPNWLAHGLLTSDLTVHGTLDAPQASANVSVRALQINDLPALDLDTHLDYDGQSLTSETHLSDGTGSLGELSTTSTLPLRAILEAPRWTTLSQHPFTISGHMTERHTNALPLPAPWLARLPFPLLGHGNFALHSEGAHRNLRGELWLEAIALPPSDPAQGCSQGPAPQVRAAVSLVDQTASFDLSLALADQPVSEMHGSVQIPLDPLLQGHPPGQARELQVSGEVDIPALETAPYLCALGQGTVVGTVELEHGLTPAAQLTAELRGALHPPVKHQSDHKQVEIRSCAAGPATLQLAVNAQPGAGQLTGQFGGCGGGPAQLEATVPLDWAAEQLWPRFGAQENMTVDVEFVDTQLRPLLDRLPGVLTAQAKVQGHIQVTGHPHTPQFAGQLELRQGHLELLSTGQQIDELHGQLRLNGSVVTFERLSALSGEGRLGAKGQLSLDGFFPRHAQLALKLAGVPFRMEGRELAALSGSAALETLFMEDRSRSALLLHTLAVQLPAESPGALQTLGNHPDVTVVERAKPVTVGSPYPLELQIRSDAPVLVQRSDFEAEVRCDLAVVYRDPELRVGGFLEFQRGRFEVFGKNFEIARGGLRFAGDTRLDPATYLTATHRLANSGKTVGVQVGGRLSRPDIRFIADTCDGTSGALTLLLTGSCASGSDPMAPNDNAESAFAAGLLQGVLTLGARRELGSVVPNLAVESGSQGYATRVRAGVSSDELIPAFMRNIIQKVYIQGAVSTAQTQQRAEYGQQDASLDFLIELYFPHSIVSSGHFATDRWGLDVTWEP